MELIEQTKYKKTELGAIPSDWEYKEIRDCINLLTGYPFPSTGYSAFGTKLLRCSNIKRGVTDWSEEITKYWLNITSELRPYLMEEGDIVIAMDGSLVGRSFARLKSNDLPAILLQRVARVRSSKVSMAYLKELLCSEYFTKHCDSVKTSSAIPHISPEDIRAYKIPLPPTLAEQEAIAEALSDADAMISSLEKLIAKKKLIKRGMMQKFFNPDRDWQEFSIKDLSKSFTKQTGFDYSAYIKPSLVREQSEKVIPFIQNKDFNINWINYDTDYFIPKEIATQFPMILLNERCLLISISGSIGNVAIFNNKKTAFHWLVWPM